MGTQYSGRFLAFGETVSARDYHYCFYRKLIVAPFSSLNMSFKKLVQILEFLESLW